MKHLKIAIALLTSAVTMNSWAIFGMGLGNNSITQNALSQQVSTINQTSSSIIQMWGILSNVCSQNQVPIVGLYSMTSAALPPYVTSISNGANCTLVITFQNSSTNESIPLSIAGKLMVVSPQCNGASGNLASCQFSNPIIFTNIFDGGPSVQSPTPNTLVGSVSNSSLGVLAYYEPNPQSAAALYISGGLAINSNNGAA